MSGRVGGAAPAVDRDPWALFESKLHPQPLRPAIVHRTQLVERLRASHDVPVVSIVSPPGYGKTTLLAQWAENNGHVAWLSVDERDNDPRTFLTYAAAALDRVEPIDQDALGLRHLGGNAVAANAVPGLAAAMSRMTQPVALVIDHVDVLHNRECLDVVTELALHLPAGSQLALATRAEPPIPLPRLRASRDLVEIGADDLAMNESDARALLAGAGVELGEAELAAVIETAEGWPVGLYLGALALKAGGPNARAGVPFSGDDKVIADYLRSELLSRLSDDEVAFLTRSSILEHMSGPLCDAVVETTGSADVLAAFEASNLLMVPLDRKREWYRYHQLFRSLLRAELARREPELAQQLHRRAAAWYDRHGQLDMAIGHAQSGGDGAHVVHLVMRAVQPTFASGRFATALRWMDWLERNQMIDGHPELAAYGAAMLAELGQAAAVERWAAAVEACPETVFSDGTTTAGVVAQLRALLCADGPEQMRHDALVAQAEAGRHSIVKSIGPVAEGVAHFLTGDLDHADARCAYGVDLAYAEGAHAALTAALSFRFLIAVQRDDWEAAASFVARALATVQTSNLHEYATTALVHAAAARVALHEGDIDRARGHVAHAIRLRPVLSYALPHVSVLACLELARACIALADAAGARAVLREARDIIHQRPLLGNVPDQLTELQDKLDSMRVGSAGASALTAAELRLLPLLATHLTFPEIGDRLHVSRHTVKTQAISIYQKLGVSSRSAAIDRAHELGLLE